MIEAGRYIVLEGPEGVGKTTQIDRLAQRLRAAGLPVRIMREPDSQSDLTARAIRQLTQDPRYPMNTRTEVLLYNAARSQSLQIIKQSVEQGVFCIVDRNYLTTLAIQYYGRGDMPDYDKINDIISFAVDGVEPDLCIVLDAPVTVLRQRLSHRNSGERFDRLDDAFLERVRSGYLWEAKQRDLPVIFALEDTEVISESIWSLASRLLTSQPKTAIHEMSEPVSVKEIIEQKYATNQPSLSGVKPNEEAPMKRDSEEPEPLIEKKESPTGKTFSITKAGREYLDKTITNTNGNVYAFTGELSAVTVAAAMARLSRRGDSMRITLLDEFAGKADSDKHLLKRVITAYGDDSVQQLAGLHFVIENASNLLTKKLEWGRLAAYLEQSTRYIYFDKKNDAGNYPYFVPDYLESNVKKQYIKAMDTIFELYSGIVHKLTEHIRNISNVPENERDNAWQNATRAQACDAARNALPVATTSTTGVYASAQELESMIIHLLSDPLLEAQQVGHDLLLEARKVLDVFLERVDIPERGGALTAYKANTTKQVSDLAKELLSSKHASSDNKDVSLVDYWPKNELLLIPDMLYEHTNLPLDQIQAEVNKWPYSKKLEVFKTYMGERLNRRHRPGRALEKAHYSWDIMCDYGIFRDLQRHRMVDDLSWQSLTPRFGYELPQIIEDANLIEQYEACFDISLKLYSLMQKTGYELEAQYATLLGHRMRWKVTYNAREAFHIHELRTGPQGHPGYRKLVLEMHHKLAEVHPLIAESMKFVNAEEDPELTRLAAEKYTQFKLKKI
jgi:dTMP kinase